MEREAYQLLLEGKNQEAEELLRKVIEENPTPSALFNLALALYKQERFEEAKEVLEKLIDTDPEHKKGIFLLGVVCRRMGDMACAKSAFEKGGFEELAQAVPELVPKKEEEIILDEPGGKLPDEPEEATPEPQEETPLTEDEPAPSTTQEDTRKDFEVVRFMVEDSKLEIPIKHFIAFITKDGSVEEKQDEIIISGTGEVIVASAELEGSVSSDMGEGQLMIDEGDEKLVIKVNADETIYFKPSYRITWMKL